MFCSLAACSPCRHRNNYRAEENGNHIASSRECAGTARRRPLVWKAINVLKKYLSNKESTMTTMTKLEKVLYTAKTHTTGGRENGESRSSDGRLNIRLSTPGTPGTGTNPEQLFAAGWSACFEGAMGLAARKMKITLPADMAIDAEVDLCLADGAVLPSSSPQRQPAGIGTRCRPVASGRRGPDVPVFQSHPRQCRGRD